MRKSGLHKQVASIFEGAPMTDNATAAETAAAEGTAPRRGFHPDRAAPRPAPAPKAAAVPDSNTVKKTGLSAAKKKSGMPDAAARRQKKMTVLVGILSVVFVGVMIMSFGGIGQSAQPVETKNDVPEAVSVSRFDPESWVFPEPLPAQMRNPLVVPKPQIMLADSTAADQMTELAVHGIVHSEAMPTAIVGGQVVMEGQVIYGATIVKISRDTVEFERDGSRWIQRVQ